MLADQWLGPDSGEYGPAPVWGWSGGGAADRLERDALDEREAQFYHGGWCLCRFPGEYPVGERHLFNATAGRCLGGAMGCLQLSLLSLVGAWSLARGSDRQL